MIDRKRRRRKGRRKRKEEKEKEKKEGCSGERGKEKIFEDIGI